MALARIITQSDVCARELAFHLLGRGYAVEIVSPDSIPDNFADLELRVDADSGDQLVASLAAHEGQRSSALDFVHRVKVPMEKATPTPFPTGGLSHRQENSVVINIGSEFADMEASADSSHAAAQSVSLRAESTLDLEPTAEPITHHGNEDAASLPADGPLPLSNSDTSEREATIVEAGMMEASPAQTSLPAAIPVEKSGEPLSYFASQTSAIALPFAGPAVVLPTWQQQPPDRPAELKSIVPAALSLAAVVLLAVFLAFGVRASAKRPIERSTVLAPIAGPTPVNAANATHPGTINAPSSQAPTHARRATSPRHRDGQIARDTVTYLDQRYQPVPRAKPLRAKASSIKIRPTN